MNNINENLKIIIGLGKTGLSCVRYLLAQGKNIVVVDSRMDPPGLVELQRCFPKVKTYLGGFDEKILSQAEELIISPGVALSEPAIASCIKSGIKVIGDIELFVRAVKVPILAITGSNGKSTVTSLVGDMLKGVGEKVAVGGNLGTPALDLLAINADYYVLELSSFQLETTSSLHSEAAVVLNISEDHMDRYKDLGEYLAAKQKIYSGCHIAIINRDEPLTYENIKLPKEIISFGMDKPIGQNFGVEKDWLMCGDEKLLPISDIKIKGVQNVMNALAALALGSTIGLPMAGMLQALRSFAGLSHRCQWVDRINGVDWYNDSKGTNVGATKAAIEGLGASVDGKIILIAGGIDKGGDFSLLQNPVAKYVREVVLIGKDASLIDKALAGVSKVSYAFSMKEAVKVSMDKAHTGDIVLLSPACTSFDMFNNFEHRGEVFIEEVNNLKDN